MNKSNIHSGAIAVIYRDKGKAREYLVVVQLKGKVSLAGGGKEVFDKDHTDTIKRELKEELNLVPNQYNLQETNVLHYFTYGLNNADRAGLDSVEKIFLAKVDDNLVIEPNISEIPKCHWLAEDEAIERISHQGLKKDFKKAIKQIK
jgi:8-oxo-dGTP pyrophosphatase MutT (NUDIX family)